MAKRGLVVVDVIVVPMSFIPDFDTARDIVKGSIFAHPTWHVMNGQQYRKDVHRTVTVVDKVGNHVRSYVFVKDGTDGK